jgi:hypothetical protein
MIYTVVWSKEAEDDLAELWLEADIRAEIVAAAQEIDIRLREDAHLQGELRYGRFRVAYAQPVAVDFEVKVEDRIARVLAIWRPF